SGEGSAKPNVEQYDRPQREERPERRNFREDRRGRHEDRSPRFERPERFERPQRSGDRPPRSATPFAKPPPRPMTRPAPEKTFSDEEILRSVKNPEPKVPKSFSTKSVPPWANKKRDDAKPARKPGRATPPNQTRLWMNLGEAMGISPIDIVNAV